MLRIYYKGVVCATSMMFFYFALLFVSCSLVGDKNYNAVFLSGFIKDREREKEGDVLPNEKVCSQGLKAAVFLLAIYVLLVGYRSLSVQGQSESSILD